MNQRGRSEILMLFAAAIWGFAFVAQVVGMKHMRPFAFNGLRFAMGALALLPVLLVSRRNVRASAGHPPIGSLSGDSPMPLWSRTMAGIAAGSVLFAAASLQQIGIKYTTAGKAGFITGLYVVIVPLLGLLRRQRVGAATIAGIVLAVVGMWLLTMKNDFSIGMGDLIVLASAVLWAVHVQTIDWCAARVAGLELACMQFLVCALISGIVSLCVEHTGMADVRAALVPLLYGGVCSVGIGYTLQVVAQKHVPPAPAAIILAMESVFAAVGGWLLLNEHLSPIACTGCVLMFAGMVVAQIRQNA